MVTFQRVIARDDINKYYAGLPRRQTSVQQTVHGDTLGNSLGITVCFASSPRNIDPFPQREYPENRGEFARGRLIISIIPFRQGMCKLNNRRSLPFYRVYGWPSTTWGTVFHQFHPESLARRAKTGENLDASNLEIAKFRTAVVFSARTAGEGVEYCLHSIKVICACKMDAYFAR